MPKTITFVPAQPGTLFLSAFDQEDLDDSEAVFSSSPIIAWRIEDDAEFHDVKPIFYEIDDPRSADNFVAGAVLSADGVVRSYDGRSWKNRDAFEADMLEREIPKWCRRQKKASGVKTKG